MGINRPLLSILVLVPAVLIAASVWWATAMPASAQNSCTTLIDRPALNQNDRGSFSQTGVQQIADDFALESDATLSRVIWHGSFHTNDLLPESNVIDFRIRIFNDVGTGSPEVSPVFDQLRTATITDSGVVFENRIIYKVTADLSPSFNATSDITLWVSILEEDGSNSGTWRWANSAPGIGDKYAFRPSDISSWVAFTGSDRQNLSLTLLDCSTPTPTPTPIPTAVPSLSQWGLIGMAGLFAFLIIVGLGLLKRERQASK